MKATRILELPYVEDITIIVTTDITSKAPARCQSGGSGRLCLPTIKQYLASIAVFVAVIVSAPLALAQSERDFPTNTAGTLVTYISIGKGISACRVAIASRALTFSFTDMNANGFFVVVSVPKDAPEVLTGGPALLQVENVNVPGTISEQYNDTNGRYMTLYPSRGIPLDVMFSAILAMGHSPTKVSLMASNVLLSTTFLPAMPRVADAYGLCLQFVR